MEYKTVPISKIKADPNQPRKFFDEEAIKEMAVSIKNEGIINDIEVDENFIIVTGERRWRAAKIAGLEEIAVKVIKITGDERYIRQVQENIHQNTMTPLDTAEALDKIRGMVSIATVAIDNESDMKHKSEFFKKGITKLHELLGTPETTIRRYLSLLGEDEEMKEALRTPGFQVTKIESIKEVPEKYRSGLRKLIATQKSIPRDTIVHLATALRRAGRYEEDENVRKLLRQNYKGLSSFEALNRINKIVPTEEDRIKEPADAVRQLAGALIKAMEVLDKHTLAELDDFHRPMIVGDLKNFGVFVQNWFKGRGQNKEIEFTKETLLKLESNKKSD